MIKPNNSLTDIQGKLLNGSLTVKGLVTEYLNNIEKNIRPQYLCRCICSRCISSSRSIGCKN